MQGKRYHLTGRQRRAGHLIICEIQLISVDEDVMTDGSLDQQKLDLMGRLGKKTTMSGQAETHSWK
ncbi:MAG: hypothetical protein IPJ13_10285 [Saprospiraceae bacterium]|nr:hypothetical protein [Saprospiraceae bacterium]